MFILCAKTFGAQLCCGETVALLKYYTHNHKTFTPHKAKCSGLATVVSLGCCSETGLHCIMGIWKKYDEYYGHGKLIVLDRLSHYFNVYVL